MKANVNLEMTNFEFLSTPVKRGQSELSISRRTVVKETDDAVKSVSEYFKQFRRNKEITNFLKLAHSKGRTFDAAKVHDILNCGNLKEILSSDAKIQAAKEKPLKSWNAQRMMTAFVAATEIKTPKK